jgi:TonB family protein
LGEQIQSAAQAPRAYLLRKMLQSVAVRLFTAAILNVSAIAGTCCAQQPTDLDKLVAPIAEAISRSGKHKVVVLPVRDADGKSSEMGAWLAKQISARLAASVPSLEIIDTSSWPIPTPTGPDSEAASKNSGQVKDLEKKAGAEIIVSGSFSSLENSLGISLLAQTFGKGKIMASSQGFLTITAEMPPPPKDSAFDQTGEKIARAGVGGVGIPRCIYCPDPNYSESLRSKKKEGIVTLQLVVGTDGRVSRIQVIKALSAELADAAVDAARKFRFEPAKGPNGKPVPVLVHYEVTFRLFR